jgi:hypothetical protein
MNPMNMYDGDQGLEYLGLMIGGNKNSPNYYMYGSLYHLYNMMIGWIADPHQTLGVSTQHSSRALVSTVMNLRVPKTVAETPEQLHSWRLLEKAVSSAVVAHYRPLLHICQIRVHNNRTISHYMLHKRNS